MRRKYAHDGKMARTDSKAAGPATSSTPNPGDKPRLYVLFFLNDGFVRDEPGHETISSRASCCACHVRPVLFTLGMPVSSAIELMRTRIYYIKEFLCYFVSII